MAIKLEKEAEKYLVGSIRRFFDEEMETEIGDLKALKVLDYIVKEIAPSIYNQAIADAKKFIQEKVADLGDTRYEAEFDFWKK